jgi:hypothetical protein
MPPASHLIIGTAACMQTYRERIAMLSECVFDINELGGLITDFLGHRFKYEQWLMTSEDIMETQSDEDRIESQAFADLVAACYILFDRAGVYRPDGFLSYVYSDWMGLDMVMSPMPY